MNKVEDTMNDMENKLHEAKGRISQKLEDMKKDQQKDDDTTIV
jgi:serine phosphatase RsbU (regulator of sigma subunit)